MMMCFFFVLLVGSFCFVCVCVLSFFIIFVVGKSERWG